MLTLALITDLHYGQDRGLIRGGHVEEAFRHFQAGVEREQADLIVELGDRINDIEADLDRERVSAVADLFATLRPMTAHLHGNHDVVNISADENAELLGCPKGSYIIDKEGYRLIFWNPDPATNYEESRGPNPAGDALDWLKMELDGADRPVVIFSHFPLDGTPLIGNPYFESRYAHLAHYPDTDRIRQVIEANGRVVACFNGHTHWFSLKTLDGIHYITVPSFSETAFTHGNTCRNYMIAGFGEDRLELAVHGLNHISMSLPLRKKGVHWEYPHREELGKIA